MTEHELVEAVVWDPRLHPRGRIGQFRRVLFHMLSGGTVKLPHGVEVKKRGGARDTRYQVGDTVTLDPGHAADIALRKFDARDLVMPSPPTGREPSVGESLEFPKAGKLAGPAREAVKLIDSLLRVPEMRGPVKVSATSGKNDRGGYRRAVEPGYEDKMPTWEGPTVRMVGFGPGASKRPAKRADELEPGDQLQLSASALSEVIAVDLIEKEIGFGRDPIERVQVTMQRVYAGDPEVNPYTAEYKPDELVAIHWEPEPDDIPPLPPTRPVEISASVRPSEEGVKGPLFDVASTLVHELGHYIDNEAFRRYHLGRGEASTHASMAAASQEEKDKMPTVLAKNPQTRSMIPLFEQFFAEDSPIQKWWEAVQESPEVEKLKSASITEMTMHKYLISPGELFARSFTQWVATRSGDPELREWLDAWQNLPEKLTKTERSSLGDPVTYTTTTPPSMRLRQWSEESFEPIGHALDEAFHELGWLRDRGSRRDWDADPYAGRGVGERPGSGDRARPDLALVPAGAVAAERAELEPQRHDVVPTKAEADRRIRALRGNGFDAWRVRTKDDQWAIYFLPPQGYALQPDSTQDVLRSREEVRVGPKRKISYEQSKALDRGRDLARSNQRRRAEEKRQAEKAQAERGAEQTREQERERELRNGFEIGDRVTGRDYFFRKQHTGVIVEQEGYPLTDGVTVLAEDGEKHLMIANSLEAAPSPEPMASPATATWRRLGERSGDPEIDAAIAAYRARGEIADEDGPVRLDAMKHPLEAEGFCSIVGKDFAAFARERGLNAYDSGEDVRAPGYDRLTNPLFGTKHDAEAFGYTDASRKSDYDEHSATVIEKDGRTVVVDWAAAQYGYDEFPFVQETQPEPQAGPATPILTKRQREVLDLLPPAEGRSYEGGFYAGMEPSDVARRIDGLTERGAQQVLYALVDKGLIDYDDVGYHVREHPRPMASPATPRQPEGKVSRVSVPSTTLAPAAEVEVDEQGQAFRDGRFIGVISKGAYTYKQKAAGHGGRVLNYATEVGEWQALTPSALDLSGSERSAAAFKGGIFPGHYRKNSRKAALAYLVAADEQGKADVYFTWGEPKMASPAAEKPGVEALDPVVIAEIERRAWLDTPDWDDWCGNACQRVSEYLTSLGISHEIESAGDDPEWDVAGPNWPYGTHTYIRLGDGTIIDPTLTQFMGEGHPRWRESPSTSKTGIFPPGHAMSRLYDPKPMASPVTERPLSAWDTGTWYHVTTPDRARLIREQGLQPRATHGGERTFGTVGLDDQVVYLWPSRAKAEEWQQYLGYRGGDFGETEVLQVSHVEPSRLGPDHEAFSELVLRPFLFERETGRPLKFMRLPSGESEADYEALLDSAGYYKDAVGGPERETLRQWLEDRPDMAYRDAQHPEGAFWRATSPSAVAPEWAPPERDPWRPTIRLLAEMPKTMRMDLAREFAERGRSAQYYGVISRDAIAADVPEPMASPATPYGPGRIVQERRTFWHITTDPHQTEDWEHTLTRPRKHGGVVHLTDEQGIPNWNTSWTGGRKYATEFEVEPGVAVETTPRAGWTEWQAPADRIRPLRTIPVEEVPKPEPMASPATEPELLVYRLPQTFYYDHISRDLPEEGVSKITRKTKQHVYVAMDDAALKDLRSDAEHYTDEGIAREMGLRGLAASARSTLKALDKGPLDKPPKPTVVEPEPESPLRKHVRIMGVDIYEVQGMQTSTRVFAALQHNKPLPLGALTVDQKQGTVELVTVQKEVRRLGIASQLLSAAREATGLPLDVDTGERSEAGAAFGEARGVRAGERGQDLSEREAEAMGARLMLGLWSASGWQPLNATARATYKKWEVEAPESQASPSTIPTGFGLPPNNRIQRLPMRNGLYYRIQKRGEPFGPEHAKTVPNVPMGYKPVVDDPRFDLSIPREGYSAFWNPHHLMQYVQSMGWTPDEENVRVVAFEGTPVGEGYDGEPRVIPRSSEIEGEVEWADFLDQLEVTPNGYGMWHEHTWGDGPDGKIVDDGYRRIGEIAPPQASQPTAGPANPRTMFHVAPREARDAIQQGGISHAEASQPTLYEPGNYLWESLPDALQYMRFWSGRDLDLYVVDARDADLRPDPLHVNHAWVTGDPISSDKLRHVDPSEYASMASPETPERSARSKGRTRAQDIASFESLLRDPDLSREDRVRYSIRLAELHGDEEKAAKLRKLLPPEPMASPASERLSLAAWSGVAEDAMERAGQGGRTWVTPEGHHDDPEVQKAERAMTEFASQVYLENGGSRGVMEQGGKLLPSPDWVQPVRVVASTWMNVEYPNARGTANSATNTISVQHKTNDLTILHEVAHLLTKTDENEEGHTPEFARTVRDLYAKYISPEAAETYWGLVGMRVEPPELDKWEQAVVEFLRRQPASEITRWSDIKQAVDPTRTEMHGPAFEALHRLRERGIVRLRHHRWELVPEQPPPMHVLDDSSEPLGEEYIYRPGAETEPMAPKLREAYREREHLRDRLGRWRDMPSIPKVARGIVRNITTNEVGSHYEDEELAPLLAAALRGIKWADEVQFVIFNTDKKEPEGWGQVIGNEKIIRLGLPAKDAFPLTSTGYHGHFKGPKGEAFPRIRLDDWREAVLYVVAHESYHVDSHLLDREQEESVEEWEAEKRGIERLEQFRALLQEAELA